MQNKRRRCGVYTVVGESSAAKGIINDYVYRKFNIGFKERGFHIPDKEPGRFPGKEKPIRFERLIYLGLAKEVISVNDAAYFSGKSLGEFRKQLQEFV